MASNTTDPTYTQLLDAVRLLQNGQGGEVVAALKPLVQQFPGHPRLHYVLGLAMDQCGDSSAAIHHVSRAIALEPGHAEAYRTLAVIFKKIGKIALASARAKDALALEPQHPDGHFLLGDISMDQGTMDAAIACFSRAIALDQEFFSAWINLGLCHKAIGQLDLALRCFERCLAIDYQNPQGHVNLALTLLLVGDYGRGFDEFEWRFRLPQEGVSILPPAGVARWHGEPLHGKKILVTAEQGYGDAIQFARFLPHLQHLGALVFLTVAKPLEPLFKGQPGMGQVQSSALWEETMDYTIPMMSLGKQFTRCLGDIPAPPYYLRADPEKVRYWHQRLPHDRFKIGLVWEGKPLHKDDPLRRRSASLDTFAPLAQRDRNDLFVSLQKEVACEQLRHPPADMDLVDAGSQVHDFSDSAAIMANLDLIITIDTAAAHLAGALGKPVWILLPFAPDWRWTMDRHSSPWYPSSRVYRQINPNHWEDPVNQMVNDLKGWQ